MIRFLIAALVIYLLFRFLRVLFASFLKPPPPGQPPSNAPSSGGPERYVDVHDARFVDIDEKKDKSDSPNAGTS